MKIAELQKTFLNSIYKKDNSIKDSLKSTHPDLAINIYQGNFLHNLKTSLSNMYSSLERLIGYEQFNDLCIEYIRNTRSRNGNLDVYGFFFPEFLKTKKMIFLYDVSRLDLASHLAYISPNYQVRSVEDFQNIDKKHYQNLCFIINPSVQVLLLSYDVLPMWHNVKIDKQMTEKKENYTLIYRNLNLDIRAMPLANRYEYDFVKQIISNKSFYQIFSTLEGRGGDGDFINTLNKLIINNIVIDFSY